MLVDDEPDVLSSLAGFFAAQAQQWDVRTASSPEEAMQHVEGADLVLSDHRMPGSMSGVEFLTQVRAKNPSAVRVLLTGHADIDVAIAALERAAVHYYLRKPCEVSDLQGLIERSLPKEAVQSLRGGPNDVH